MSDPTETVAVPAAFLKGVGLLALLPVIILQHAWCLWLMWGWFALPSWGALTFAQALGLSGLVMLLRARTTPKGQPGPGLSDTIAYMIGLLFILGIGGVLRLCGAGS